MNIINDHTNKEEPSKMIYAIMGFVAGTVFGLFILGIVQKNTFAYTKDKIAVLVKMETNGENRKLVDDIESLTIDDLY